MSDMHVLEGDGTKWRIVMHFAVPNANNLVNVNYRTALVNSGLGGTTVLADAPSGEVFGASIQHPGEPPRPFLRPAFDQTKGKALAAMGKAMGRGLEREAKKLAGPFAKSGLGAKRRRRAGRRRR